MTDKVLKAFNTITRRFKPGQNVSEADVVDHALGFDGLKAAGFIGSEVTFTPEPAAAHDDA